MCSLSAALLFTDLALRAVRRGVVARTVSSLTLLGKPCGGVCPTALAPLLHLFANCMHGGARPKRTCLATSVSTLIALSRKCDNQHTHLPWGRCGLEWSTAAEVKYPHELCKLWSRLLIAHLVKQDTIAPVQSAEDQPHAFSSVSTLAQTRKSPALMPEFRHVQSLTALKPSDLKTPSTLAKPLVLSLKSGSRRL